MYSQIKCLAIDDSFSDLLSLEMALNSLGSQFELTTVQHPELFEEVLSTKDFDILFLDYNLSSRKNGIDLIHGLQKEYKAVVLYTAFTSINTVTLSQQQRPINVLSKPINIVQLEGIIKSTFLDFNN